MFALSLETNVRTCTDCGTPLDWQHDPVIYVRTQHGFDKDYCDRCCGPIIGEAMDVICDALWVEPVENTDVYVPHQFAAE